MATPAEAAAHFAARLAFETDVSDVYSELATGSPSFVLIDTRSLEAWKQGHIRGAIHMPKPDMPRRIPAEFAPGTRFVVYCWGPGCNGATRAGLIISELGYPVKEMIGGFEYWAREGLPVDRIAKDLTGNEVSMDATRPADPLTNIVPGGAGGLVGFGATGIGAGIIAAGGIACDC
ncbi:MAG: rhodanese-like domain-containing protein [Actinomycetes bacterium]|nr:MAG: sulfurtransferase [Actinomycetota bacterium]